MITLTVPTMREFWRWLCRFAYRRWSVAEPQKPVGIPGNRDPDHPCDAYSPRPKKSQDWGDCLTDGHWLCAECCHRASDEVLAENNDLVEHFSGLKVTK